MKEARKVSKLLVVVICVVALTVSGCCLFGGKCSDCALRSVCPCKKEAPAEPKKEAPAAPAKATPAPAPAPTPAPAPAPAK